MASRPGGASVSRLVFNHYAGKDGMTVEGFRRFCLEKGYALDSACLDAAFVKLDKDESGLIRYEEFFAWWSVGAGISDETACHHKRLSGLEAKDASAEAKVHERFNEFRRASGGGANMSREQFRIMVYKKGYCLSGEELEEAMLELDKDHNDAIDFSEYLRWFQKQKDDNDAWAHLKHEDSDGTSAYFVTVGEYFQKYDADFNGYLTHEEFTPLYKELLNAGTIKSSLEAMVKEVDKNGDGQISLGEFLKWYTMSPEEWAAEAETEEEAKEEAPKEVFAPPARQGKEAGTEAKGHERFNEFQRASGGAASMSREQFRIMVYKKGYCLSGEELEEAMLELDEDHNDAIDFSEYLRWFQKQKDDNEAWAHLKHEDSDGTSAYVAQVGEYFHNFDADFNGYLTLEEFTPLYEELKKGGTIKASIEAMVKEVDCNGDGQISLGEFLKWYTMSAEEWAAEAETK